MDCHQCWYGYHRSTLYRLQSFKKWAWDIDEWDQESQWKILKNESFYKFMYSSSLRNSSTSFDLLGDLYHINISIRFSSTLNHNIFEAKEKKIFSKNSCTPPRGNFSKKKFFRRLQRYFYAQYSRIVYWCLYSRNRLISWSSSRNF